jgi:hypothetical protein
MLSFIYSMTTLHEQHTIAVHNSGQVLTIPRHCCATTTAMRVQVEKYSDVLGRNAVWTKTQRIKKLPRYLCVQFMRFFWKATPDSRDHVGVKCKVSNHSCWCFICYVTLSYTSVYVALYDFMRLLKVLHFVEPH